MKHSLQSILELSFYPNVEIEAHQVRYLRYHLRYLQERSPFYSRRLQTLGIHWKDIRSLEDLASIPLTTKDELSEHIQDFLAVSPSEIRDICQTSGTTGEPLLIPQSASDLERLALNEALAFSIAGITARDRMLIACAMDRSFMAGLAYFLGIQKLGGTAIRTGSSSIPHIVQTMKKIHPTVIVGVPTILLSVGERCQAEGISLPSLGIEKILCIGESLRNTDLSLNRTGERLRMLFQAQLFSTYASTEMATTFCECPMGCGGHLQPYLMVLEVIDDTGKVLKDDGATGELVATPLRVTGMPLLRFATGDIATVYRHPCACGRQTLRVGPILGRKQQRLKVKGCSFFPAAISAALQEIETIREWYLEVYSHTDGGDEVIVVIAEYPDQPPPEVIAEVIAGRIRVKPIIQLRSVEIVRSRIYDPTYRKPRTFFDFRNSSPVLNSLNQS